MAEQISTLGIPTDVKEDDMSLFKSPMQQVTNTQQPTTVAIVDPQQQQQQQQQQIPEEKQQPIAPPQGPLITSNLESPITTTTAPVTTPHSSTTTTPDPTNIENFPNYNIKLQDFNVWDQHQPKYPEFSHQQAQAPVNPDQDKEKDDNEDGDTDVLPVDPLPGFPSSSSILNVQRTTSAPPVTRPQLGTTTVSTASLLAKLYNNNKKASTTEKDEPAVDITSTNGNSADASVKNTLNSIDGPSLGTGVLKSSPFAKDQTTQSFTNTNLEDTSAVVNPEPSKSLQVDNQNPSAVDEASISNNAESSVKEETPTTPIPASDTTSYPVPEQVSNDNNSPTITQPQQQPTTVQQPTQPPTTQPQQPTTQQAPPQGGASNVLQESSTVESFQNENDDTTRDVGHTPNDNNNGMNLQQAQAPPATETQPPTTPVTTQPPTTPAVTQPAMTSPQDSSPPVVEQGKAPDVQSTTGIYHFH